MPFGDVFVLGNLKSVIADAVVSAGIGRSLGMRVEHLRLF